jgi:hypothetical protein
MMVLVLDVLMIRFNLMKLLTFLLFLYPLCFFGQNINNLPQAELNKILRNERWRNLIINDTISLYIEVEQSNLASKHFVYFKTQNAPGKAYARHGEIFLTTRSFNRFTTDDLGDMFSLTIKNKKTIIGSYFWIAFGDMCYLNKCTDEHLIKSIKIFFNKNEFNSYQDFIKWSDDLKKFYSDYSIDNMKN